MWLHTVWQPQIRRIWGWLHPLRMYAKENGPGMSLRRSHHAHRPYFPTRPNQHRRYAHEAIRRILNENGLIQKRRKKHKRKRDLAEIKKKWKLFGQFTVDTKDLKDIPHYWPQMRTLALPKYQFTAREVRSGLMFLGFSNEKSAASACLFGRLLCEHLRNCGIDLKKVKFQTDNGSEFIGCFRQDRPRYCEVARVDVRLARPRLCNQRRTAHQGVRSTLLSLLIKFFLMQNTGCLPLSSQPDSTSFPASFKGKKDDGLNLPAQSMTAHFAPITV